MREEKTTASERGQNRLGYTRRQLGSDYRVECVTPVTQHLRCRLRALAGILSRPSRLTDVEPTLAAVAAAMDATFGPHALDLADTNGH